jgi:YegS/Rv2252/BmrU family lipid kinase
MSKKIQVIINPASGEDEPVVNVLNKVFTQYDVVWDAFLTHEAGDATRLAHEAVAAGADVVAAYGGDGTIMEVANALAGGSVPLGILPGGTGNGLAVELHIPMDLAQAVTLLCESNHVQGVDLIQVNGRYSTLHTYIGLDKSQQAPRESKDRLGMFAYVASILKIIKEPRIATYHITIDGQEMEVEGIMCLLTNAIGLGLKWAATSHIRPDDGLLDVLIFKKDVLSIVGDLLEELREPGHLFQAGQGREVTVRTDPPQPVWIDGEPIGETPVTAVLIPHTLPVIVPLP